jgi:hypothetical protein
VNLNGALPDKRVDMLIGDSIRSFQNIVSAPNWDDDLDYDCKANSNEQNGQNEIDASDLSNYQLKNAEHTYSCHEYSGRIRRFLVPSCHAKRIVGQ